MILSIPKKFTKVGINCSGGADSSLLLFLMGFLFQKRPDLQIYVITNRNEARDHTQPERVKEIIDFCSVYHGKKYVREHWVLPVTDYSERGRHIQQLFSDGKVDLVLSGVTSNPIVDEKIYMTDNDGHEIELTDFPLPERLANEDTQNWFASVDGQGVHFDENGQSPNMFYSPFNKMDKRDIIAIYRRAKIFDSLLPMTRSCEGEAEDTNNFTTECGHCWWCLERQWAINETEH